MQNAPEFDKFLQKKVKDERNPDTAALKETIQGSLHSKAEPHMDAKSYWAIGLRFFLLKTLEKKIGNDLSHYAVVKLALHGDQYAYQTD